MAPRTTIPAGDSWSWIKSTSCPDRGLKPDDRLETFVGTWAERHLAAIRSDEPIDDREPEAEAPVSSAPAPEAVERAVDLSGRHSRSAIAYRDLDPPSVLS